jgi:SPP1 family predicted phage head-tail adaptor
MRAGRLDRKIDLQRFETTYSPSGSPIEEWSNIAARLSASIIPISGDELYGAPQEVASEQVQFEIRYSQAVADLSPLDRVIYPALDDEEEITERRICDILAVHEIGRRQALRIVAKRRVDVS